MSQPKKTEFNFNVLKERYSLSVFFSLKITLSVFFVVVFGLQSQAQFQSEYSHDIVRGEILVWEDPIDFNQKEIMKINLVKIQVAYSDPQSAPANKLWEMRFDSLGYKTDQLNSSPEDSSTIFNHYIYKYNNKNQLIEVDINDFSYKRKLIFYYDKAGKRIKEHVTSSNLPKDLDGIYKYDEHKKLLEINYNKGLLVHSFSYNSGGLLISDSKISNNKLTNKREYKYDKDNLLIEVIENRSGDGVFFKKDNTGNYSMERFNRDGVLESFKHYEYDNNKNLILNVKDKYSSYTHFYKFNNKGLVITDSTSESRYYIYRFRYEYYNREIFKPKEGQAIVFQNVFFNVNKFDLLPESFEELNKLITYLKENSSTTINISGHTDNTGNEESNKSLSTLRAKAIRDYMILENIESSRISYMGYGSSLPIANNNTEEGRPKNRRVEFMIR